MWRKKHIKEFDTICVSGIHWVLERTLCRKGGTTAHDRQRINVLNTEWFSLLVKWKKKYAAPQIQDNVSSIWYRVDTQKWQLWSIVENSTCAQPTYRPFWRSHWGSSVGQGVGGKESNGLWGGAVEVGVCGCHLGYVHLLDLGKRLEQDCEKTSDLEEIQGDPAAGQKEITPVLSWGQLSISPSD